MDCAHPFRPQKSEKFSGGQTVRSTFQHIAQFSGGENDVAFFSQSFDGKGKIDRGACQTKLLADLFAGDIPITGLQYGKNEIAGHVGLLFYTNQWGSCRYYTKLMWNADRSGSPPYPGSFTELLFIVKIFSCTYK